MENKSLKQQMKITFISIVVCSLIASAISMAVGIFIFISKLNSNVIKPANYYEQQIPRIRETIKTYGTRVLDLEFRDKMEGQIPSEGIKYMVIDSAGANLYGNLGTDIIKNKADIMNKINTTISSDKSYINVIPVLDEEGSINGCVLLSYKLKASTDTMNGNFWIVLLLILVFASPFVFIVVFTGIFSKRFANRIIEPLNLLKNASENIMNKNLDFNIDYKANNELGALCTAFSDMKNELERTLIEQWHLQQEQEEIIEELTHDLKAPLAVILSYTDALCEKRNQTEDKLNRYLAVINKNVKKCSNMVSDMREIVEHKNMDNFVELNEIELRSFISDKVEYYRIQGKKKNIQVKVTFEIDVITKIIVDERCLDRILDNIFSNSLEYTPQNEIIEILVQHEEERIVYTISDSGKGFSGKDLENATRKFYRGNEARPKEDNHSGLGLYIANQLAEKMGGELHLYNSEKGGAVVVFWHKVRP